MLVGCLVAAQAQPDPALYGLGKPRTAQNALQSDGCRAHADMDEAELCFVAAGQLVV